MDLTQKMPKSFDPFQLSFKYWSTQLYRNLFSLNWLKFSLNYSILWGFSYRYRTFCWFLIVQVMTYTLYRDSKVLGKKYLLVLRSPNHKKKEVFNDVCLLFVK